MRLYSHMSVPNRSSPLVLVRWPNLWWADSKGATNQSASKVQNRQTKKKVCISVMTRRLRPEYLAKRLRRYSSPCGVTRSLDSVLASAPREGPIKHDDRRRWSSRLSPSRTAYVRHFVLGRMRNQRQIWVTLSRCEIDWSDNFRGMVICLYWSISREGHVERGQPRKT